MSEKPKLPRRSFLKQATGALGAAAQIRRWPAHVESQLSGASAHAAQTHSEITYPRVFCQQRTIPPGQSATFTGRKGVLTCVQHNTYDVEFYGPNRLTVDEPTANQWIFNS